MMKLVNKPIEVIAWFDWEGNLLPIKFRYLTDDQGYIKVKVDRVIERRLDKFAGNRMWRYRCEADVNNLRKVFELSYEIDTCKWFLYKI